MKKAIIGICLLSALCLCACGQGDQPQQTLSEASAAEDATAIQTEAGTDESAEGSGEELQGEEIEAGLIEEETSTEEETEEEIDFTNVDVIKLVQQALNDLGYDCGEPDGIIGPNTQNMIYWYKVDFELDPETSIDSAMIDSLGIRGYALAATRGEEFVPPTTPEAEILYTVIDTKNAETRFAHIYVEVTPGEQGWQDKISEAVMQYVWIEDGYEEDMVIVHNKEIDPEKETTKYIVAKWSPYAADYDGNNICFYADPDDPLNYEMAYLMP